MGMVNSDTLNPVSDIFQNTKACTISHDFNEIFSS